VSLYFLYVSIFGVGAICPDFGKNWYVGERGEPSYTRCLTWSSTKWFAIFTKPSYCLFVIGGRCQKWVRGSIVVIRAININNWQKWLMLMKWQCFISTDFPFILTCVVLNPLPVIRKMTFHILEVAKPLSF